MGSDDPPTVVTQAPVAGSTWVPATAFNSEPSRIGPADTEGARAVVLLNQLGFTDSLAFVREHGAEVVIASFRQMQALSKQPDKPGAYLRKAVMNASKSPAATQAGTRTDPSPPSPTSRPSESSAPAQDGPLSPPIPPASPAPARAVVVDVGEDPDPSALLAHVGADELAVLQAAAEAELTANPPAWLHGKTSGRFWETAVRFQMVEILKRQ
jgi:hypothetical protein